ncbi:MAG TPA: PIN domain-containing protein [Solirubrobacterales bacterium]
MIAPDTSVLIAGFIPDHPFYSVAEAALTEVRGDGRLIAHTMAETYAVLSGPADVFRVEPEVVVAYLDEFLGGSAPIQPRPDAHREALDLLSGAGRGGASIYDALIALAARDANATLISLDRRARPTYELCGVEARFLDEG